MEENNNTSIFLDESAPKETPGEEKLISKYISEFRKEFPILYDECVGRVEMSEMVINFLQKSLTEVRNNTIKECSEKTWNGDYEAGYQDGKDFGMNYKQDYADKAYEKGRVYELKQEKISKSIADFIEQEARESLKKEIIEKLDEWRYKNHNPKKDCNCEICTHYTEIKLIINKL